MVTKGYGFAVDDIDWSCPTDLEPYAKAHKLAMKEIDAQLYDMGIYAMSAVAVAIERNFSKRPKGKYIEKPFLEEAWGGEKTGNEKELQKQRELFVARFEAMGANFRLSQKAKDGAKI